MTLLQLHDLESGTWGRRVSLTLSAGETLLLLGRNGAGRTTLLNTVAGLVPVRSGAIVFRGRDVTAIDEQGRTDCGIRIALEGRHVFRRLTVQRNLLAGAFRRKDRSTVEADLHWILDVFPDLRTKLHTRAGLLSGGQQSQLNCGRALMGRPDLLLLDEPALGLDPVNVAKLLGALRRVREQRGVAAVVAEQNGAFMREFSRRVAILVGGEIVFDGPLADARQKI